MPLDPPVIRTVLPEVFMVNCGINYDFHAFYENYIFLL